MICYEVGGSEDYWVTRTDHLRLKAVEGFHGTKWSISMILPLSLVSRNASKVQGNSKLKVRRYKTSILRQISLRFQLLTDWRISQQLLGTLIPSSISYLLSTPTWASQSSS